MIIVLEGCDGAGKSTLAEYLCSKYRLLYHHEGPPPAHVEPLEHYAAQVETWRFRLEAKIDGWQGVVFDRLAMGERIYGPIYRGHDRLGATGWRLMKRLFAAGNVIHIVAMPSYEVCLTNWLRNQGNELVTDRTQFERMYDRYRTITAQDDYAFHLFYDYTKPYALAELEHALDLRLSRKQLPAGTIGSPTAKYLFVGEKGARRNSLTADLPFFGHVNSSGYLWDALDAAGYRDHEVAVTNAERWDGREIVWPETKFIVPLGGRAKAECERRNTGCSIVLPSLPHPQYWKRFHANDFQGYVSKLRSLRV